ncbi:MAG: enoyl-CoA hydratase-related protein [Pseudomonadota bacterium]
MSSEDYSCILVDEPIERVRRITLNRPEKRNALSDQLRRELFDALEKADVDETISLMIITGGPDLFSAGYDLSEPKDKAANFPFHTSEGIGIWPRQVTDGGLKIWDLQKPVIAQVSGFCLAGGFELSQACDLVFASDDAKFGYPPVRSLSPPDNQTMPWLMGFRKAMYLMLTGDSLSGKEAVEQGLANKSFPSDELEDEVLKVAQRMTLIPTDVQQICKRSVHRQMEIMGIRAGVRAGTELQALAQFTPTALDFFEKIVAGGVKSAITDRDTKFGDYSAGKKD